MASILAGVVFLAVIGGYLFIGFQAIRDKEIVVGTNPFTGRKKIYRGVEAEFTGYFLIITMICLTLLPLLVGFVFRPNTVCGNLCLISIPCVWLVSLISTQIILRRRK